MNPTAQAKQDEWSKHLAAQRSQGVSQKAYCQSQGLKAHQFSYWKTKLLGQRGGKPSQPPESGFIPVAVSRQPAVEGLSLLLPNGVRLSGISEHNIGIVQQLLESLR